MAHINGIYEFENKMMNADVDFIFSDFQVTEPDFSYFMPPPDMWCQGRTMDQDLGALPLFYSYTSEAMWHIKLPVSTDEHNMALVLSTRQEYYDYLQKVSRVDYKPIDIGGLIDPSKPTISSYVNEIKDFSSGIMYRVWADYGNCSISWVGQDPIGDITINDDGSVTMMSPLEMFGLQYKFAKNGIGYQERGIPMEYFVTQEVLKSQLTGASENITIALSMSGGMLQVEGDDSIERNIPEKLEKYPTEMYYDWTQRHRYNIIGFREGEPDFDLFDVTPCFLNYQMFHVMIKTGWDETFIISQGLKKARDQVRLSVQQAAKITPIRVQNIEMVERPDEKALYIIFTIIDFPRESIPGVNVSTLPEEVTIVAAAAVDNLKKVVQAGNLKIELPQTTGGYGAAVAASDFFQEVDRPQGPDGPTINTNSGYSAGSMAGLGITMLILAFGGSVALLVLVFKW